MSWVMTAGSNFAFEVAAKLLQVKTTYKEFVIALSNGTIATPYMT